METNKADLSQTAANIAELLGSINSVADYQHLMKDVFKQVAERALQAEMSQHLGYNKHASTGKNTGNSRNGTSRKTIIADDGHVAIDTRVTATAALSPTSSASINAKSAASVMKSLSSTDTA
jgi:transposase-like protein